jgi:DNA replication protein DnaC
MGPPGLGKIMLAVGLGLKAIDAGYSVCYERMVKLVDILDNAPYQKIPTLLTKSRRFANVETTRGAGTIRWS